MTRDPKVLTVARDGFEGEIPAATPPGNPDVRLVVVSAARVVLVRTCRTYLQSLLGFLGAATIGVLPTDPTDPLSAWNKIVLAAGLALFPAFVAAAQNILELLAKLDVAGPEWRG